MFRFTIRDVLWLTVVVAIRDKGGRCPQCGGMVAGIELGEVVLSCPGCGQTFGRA